MGLLQSPDPAQKLARQYGIRGIFTPELVPSIQPVVLIDDLSGTVENTPQRICVASGTRTGAAGVFATFRIETPPGVIAEIMQITAFIETNALLNISFGATPSVAAPTSLFIGQLTDGRLRSQGQVPAAILGALNELTLIAPIIFTIPLTPVAAVFQTPWAFPIVLGRTDGANFDFMELQCGTSDLDVTISMMWREFSAAEVR